MCAVTEPLLNRRAMHYITEQLRISSLKHAGSESTCTVEGSVLGVEEWSGGGGVEWGWRSGVGVEEWSGVEYSGSGG